MEYDFILASSSPRRLQLLSQAGIEPKEVVSPEIDEAYVDKETPLSYVKRMALEKALSVASVRKKTNILAADTIVVCGRRILFKTDDEQQARKNLFLLSGRRHRVITAVCFINKQGKSNVSYLSTLVKFKRLSALEIEDYIDSLEWKGKAGSYAVQGRAEAFVQMLIGSWSNVVGLPLCRTVNILRQIK